MRKLCKSFVCLPDNYPIEPIHSCDLGISTRLGQLWKQTLEVLYINQTDLNLVNEKKERISLCEKRFFSPTLLRANYKLAESRFM